ncbi:hypothetical protein IWW55_007024, partial [Coemansia sp. RSA 2706]
MVSINIKSSGDSKITVEVELEQTVQRLKEQISEQLAETPANCQRLIYAGKILKDEEKLATYKIAEGNTVHLVKSGPKKAAAAAT